MKSIMFHAIKPSVQPDRGWILFRQESRATVHIADGVERLSTGVWLVAEPDTLMVADRLAAIAKRHGIAFRLLRVEHEGEWPPQWPLGR